MTKKTSFRIDAILSPSLSRDKNLDSAHLDKAEIRKCSPNSRHSSVSPVNLEKSLSPKPADSTSPFIHAGNNGYPSRMIPNSMGLPSPFYPLNFPGGSPMAIQQNGGRAPFLSAPFMCHPSSAAALQMLAGSAFYSPSVTGANSNQLAQEWLARANVQAAVYGYPRLSECWTGNFWSVFCAFPVGNKMVSLLQTFATCVVS